MTQKQESIWTKDLTPSIMKVMTADITPDFSGELWTKDITHIVVGSLAVFGLVLSSLVTMAGVTTLGVNVELAFAQQEAASQTASLALADNSAPSLPPLPAAMPMANGSTTGQRPPVDAGMGSSTNPALAASVPGFCPKIMRTIGRGSREGTSNGDVGQLQQFMASHFGMNAKDVVTGFFGSTTQALLMKFQQEQGIAPAPTAGPLTRAAIARLCNPSGKDPLTTKGDLMRNGANMGSSTPMGTTTPMGHDDMRQGSGVPPVPAMPPMPAMPPAPPVLPPARSATTAPTSYNYGSSNAASVVEALNEIGDGYGRLLTASLSLLGL